jgi:hypothetical protein
MLVNNRSAKKCCKGCDPDYGKSDNRKAKQKLKRAIRHRENRDAKNEIY